MFLICAVVVVLRRCRLQWLRIQLHVCHRDLSRQVELTCSCSDTPGKIFAWRNSKATDTLAEVQVIYVVTFIVSIRIPISYNFQEIIKLN